MSDVFTEREVVSVPEIAEGTGLDIEEVADVLYGGSYMVEDKEEIKDFLGVDSLVDVKMYFGTDEE